MKNIFFFLILFLLLVGCRPESTPEPEPRKLTCDVKTILLEESFFPGQVHIQLDDSPIPEAPLASAERIFYVETNTSVDIVQQDIMNFGSIAKASNFFGNREKWSFRTDADKGPWQTPESLLDFNFAADQSHVGCGQDLSEEICQWLAQYSGYYVHLQSIISESGMTVEIFADAVQEIDARMVRCLEK